MPLKKTKFPEKKKFNKKKYELDDKATEYNEAVREAN